MKVAHLISHLFGSIGGLQVCLHNVCDRHVSAGIDTTVFCCDAGRNRFETAYGVSTFPTFPAITKCHWLSKRFFTRHVSRVQERERFDVWQIYGGYPFGALLADFFHARRIPCVLRCSGDDIQIDDTLQYGVRRNAKVDRIIRRSYPKMPAVVAITDSVVEEYLKLDIPRHRIHLISNGVDPQRLTTPVGADIRRRHDIPQGGHLILSVGRMHPKKGYQLIPDILDALMGQGISAYWMVIGRGARALGELDGFRQHRDRIRLIEQIGSPPSGQPDLPTEELIGYYQGADVFAMTSLLETFGIVIVEAMAAGLPVVCFDVPGVRDVARGDCGAICPPGDAGAFAAGIETVILAKAASGALSTRCRQHAQAYSWDLIASRYLKVYRQLMDRTLDTAARLSNGAS